MTQLKKDLMSWSDSLMEFHLPRWEELPNFDLYMDQVITLIEGYLYILSDGKENVLTSAMINNYVKQKLVPKAEKKRYNRMHMAYLIAITVLKQVLTITKVKEGIEYQSNISGLKEAYNMFCEELESGLSTIANQLKNGEGAFQLDSMELRNSAMKFVTISFACKLVAEKMVRLQNSYQEEQEETK